MGKLAKIKPDLQNRFEDKLHQVCFIFKQVTESSVLVLLDQIA